MATEAFGKRSATFNNRRLMAAPRTTRARYTSHDRVDVCITEGLTRASFFVLEYRWTSISLETTKNLPITGGSFFMLAIIGN